MPRVLFAHHVTDTDHWVSKHSERVEGFAAWGSNVVDYVTADESNWVIVGVDVHDMDAMHAAMASPEIEAAKRAHGVIEPVHMFVETD
ncbi:MAG: hypothetical protein M8866_02695 [marine benthic group bacterium]|jgi:hypothetical protein|nr:hypothetical protein [Candidatus Benthicola marisminoris]